CGRLFKPSYSVLPGRNHFPACACAQGLERSQRRTLAQKAHGAVGEGEVGPPRMAAAEGACPILQRGKVCPGRHPVVDRRGTVERDLKHGPCIRNVTPSPPAADGSCIGPNKRSAAVEFRVKMEALAEEARVAGAVIDVRKAHTALNPEDAVP